jgi:hypothetical protein
MVRSSTAAAEIHVVARGGLLSLIRRPWALEAGRGRSLRRKSMW